MVFNEAERYERGPLFTRLWAMTMRVGYSSLNVPRMWDWAGLPQVTIVHMLSEWLERGWNQGVKNLPEGVRCHLRSAELWARAVEVLRSDEPLDVAAWLLPSTRFTRPYQAAAGKAIVRVMALTFVRMAVRSLSMPAVTAALPRSEQEPTGTSWADALVACAHAVTSTIAELLPAGEDYPTVARQQMVAEEAHQRAELARLAALDAAAGHAAAGGDGGGGGAGGGAGGEPAAAPVPVPPAAGGAGDGAKPAASAPKERDEDSDDERDPRAPRRRGEAPLDTPLPLGVRLTLAWNLVCAASQLQDAFSSRLVRVRRAGRTCSGTPPPPTTPRWRRCGRTTMATRWTSATQTMTPLLRCPTRSCRCPCRSLRASSPLWSG
jgi:hypothetical protein